LKDERRRVDRLRDIEGETIDWEARGGGSRAGA